MGAKESVRQSLVKVVERGDRIESISATAENLQIEAGMFKKNARKTHMHFCIQQWKMIALCVCILAVLGLSLGLWSLNIGQTDDAEDMLNMNDNNTQLDGDLNVPNPVGICMETDV